MDVAEAACRRSPSSPHATEEKGKPPATPPGGWGALYHCQTSTTAPNSAKMGARRVSRHATPWTLGGMGKQVGSCPVRGGGAGLTRERVGEQGSDELARDGLEANRRPVPCTFGSVPSRLTARPARRPLLPFRAIPPPARPTGPMKIAATYLFR